MNVVQYVLRVIRSVPYGSPFLYILPIAAIPTASVLRSKVILHFPSTRLRISLTRTGVVELVETSASWGSLTMSAGFTPAIMLRMGVYMLIFFYSLRFAPLLEL